MVILNDRISNIEIGDRILKSSNINDNVIDAKTNYVLPGFVDIHCHGGFGSSFMDLTESDFITVLDYYEELGVTTIFPTSISCSERDMIQFLETYRKVALIKNLYGVHFEGPYLSKKKAGAQNSTMCITPRKRFIEQIVNEYPEIKRWTIAPEKDTNYEIVNLLKENNIVVSAGHTSALYGNMIEAFKQGYSHITHLYSGMDSIVYINGIRRAGAVEAALFDDTVTVELICDGIHLPYELIELVYKIKKPEKIAIVSDAMRATGLHCKKSILGNRNHGTTVIIEDNVAKLPDRTSLAGSITPLSEMVKRIAKNTRIPLVDIIKMATYSPSKIMRVDDDIGELAIGKKANILIADENLNVNTVIVNGVISSIKDPKSIGITE